MGRKNNLLKGSSSDVINQNVRTLKEAGYPENQAIAIAMKHSRKGTAAKKAAKAVVNANPLTIGPNDVDSIDLDIE